MKWKTRITEMLGIRYPIIQGAYAGFGTSKIAVPVSEAGGLGIITAGALKTPKALRADIRRAKTLTDKPIGVNLSIGICPEIDEMREVAIEEGISVVETAAYKATDHGKRLKEAGVKWIHKVATVNHAIIAEKQVPIRSRGTRLNRGVDRSFPRRRRDLMEKFTALSKLSRLKRLELQR